MEPYFQNPIPIYIFKILKQQFIYTIKLSQIDSSPDKAHNNPHTFFFLHHCIELLIFLILKILEMKMDIHHFTKLPLLGFFKRVTQTN